MMWFLCILKKKDINQAGIGIIKQPDDNDGGGIWSHILVLQGHWVGMVIKLENWKNDRRLPQTACVLMITGDA